MTDSEHHEDEHTEHVVVPPYALGGPRPAATFDQLMKKKRRTAEFTIPSVGDDGETVDLVMRYRAIGSSEYDRLIAAHPPTKEQQKNGAIYNSDEFAPALISAVSSEPKLTVEQAATLFRSDEWSSGEAGSLFINALRLQNAGLDIPFTGTD